MTSKSVEEILRKYSGKISSKSDVAVGDVSKEYVQFKKDMMPQFSRYEKWARSFGGLMKVNPSKKDLVKMQRNLSVAHLDITPAEVVSFSFFGAFIIFVVGLLIFLGIFFLQPNAGVDGLMRYVMGPAGLFLFLIFIGAMFVFYYIYISPERMAKLWRLKAGAQMVPCILYVVVYMKHTSNLERAIAFASKHLKAPLSLDLKKIFWDVETGKFSTIKESLDNYLKSWENDAVEFVEAFHLIESSLYEPSNAQRVLTLEKSLQVILDGVYENMMVFSRSIRSPLTNLYMLGIVLPTLGLALLPLASTLLGDMIKFYHVFILFNLIVPFFVFYLTNQILLRRPEGYGESENLELNPEYKRYASKGPYFTAAAICIPFFILGILPLLFSSVFFVETLGLQPDYSLATFGLEQMEDVWFFDFKSVETGETIKTLDELRNARSFSSVVGPFGVGALLLSLFIPLSIALFFSMAYGMKTKYLIKARKDTKQLEKEFTNSLFQLGNRLGDGMPAEIAFAKVAESTRGQKTADFFKIVNGNLRQRGMSLERAIFDKRAGAIIYFPSRLIETSMRILLESVRKGLKIAAESLMSISEYIKNIQKVTRRLQDLLAEVVSDMKSNIVFLAPLLSGIIVGLTAMITFILNKLEAIFAQVGEGGASISGFGDIGGLLNLFDILKMVPPYYMQIAIGIYIIQIVFILSNVLVAVDSGDDKLKRTSDTGKNLNRGILMYFIVTLGATLVLSILAGIALAGI